MKKETMQAKLMALLAGQNSEVAEQLEETKKQANARKGNIKEITEEEIQTFREAQGILYFLRAPSLFQLKTCSHCGEQFLVSRLYVANCSYTCIRRELEEIGIKWTRDRDVEALIQEVYDGNEPIWIKNLPQLKKALEKLTSLASQDLEPSELQSSPAATSGEDSTSLVGAMPS